LKSLIHLYFWARLVFLGLRVGLFVTVPGTANPLNSQLQLSHNKLNLKKIFEKKEVGR